MKRFAAAIAALVLLLSLIACTQTDPGADPSSRTEGTPTAGSSSAVSPSGSEPPQTDGTESPGSSPTDISPSTEEPTGKTDVVPEPSTTGTPTPTPISDTPTADTPTTDVPTPTPVTPTPVTPTPITPTPTDTPTPTPTDTPSTDTPTPTPTKTEEPPTPSLPPREKVDLGGSAVSNTGKSINVYFDYTVKENDEGNFEVSVTAYLDHYSLYCGKRSTSNNITIGEEIFPYSTPGFSFDIDQGKQHTFLASAEYTYTPDSLPETLVLSACWLFNGTYSGLPIGLIKAEAEVDLRDVLIVL